MSKYEIVELDTGEYAIRSKRNWFEKLFGLDTYYSLNLLNEIHTLNPFTKTKDINRAKEVIRLLEKRDKDNAPIKVVRVIND